MTVSVKTCEILETNHNVESNFSPYMIHGYSGAQVHLVVEVTGNRSGSTVHSELEDVMIYHNQTMQNWDRVINYFQPAISGDVYTYDLTYTIFEQGQIPSESYGFDDAALTENELIFDVYVQERLGEEVHLQPRKSILKYTPPKITKLDYDAGSNDLAFAWQINRLGLMNTATVILKQRTYNEEKQLFKLAVNSKSTDYYSYSGSSYVEQQSVESVMVLNIKDAFSDITVEKVIPPDFELVNFGYDGNSIAFGTKSSNDGRFECALPAKFNTVTIDSTADIGDSLHVNGILYAEDELRSNFYTENNGQVWNFDSTYLMGSTYIGSSRTPLDTHIKNIIRDAMFPIGSIYITATPTNPANFIGGTWTQIGMGRVLAGQGTGYDANGNSKSIQGGEKAGEYTHQLSEAESPFKRSYKEAANYSLQSGTSGGFAGRVAVTNGNTPTGTNPTEVKGDAHNVTQPYMGVYFWQRIEAEPYKSSAFESGGIETGSSGASFTSLKITNTKCIRLKELVEVTAGKRTFFRSLDDMQFYIWWFDADKKYLASHTSAYSSGGSITIPMGASYAGICLRRSTDATISASDVKNGFLIY